MYFIWILFDQWMGKWFIFIIIFFIWYSISVKNINIVNRSLSYDYRTIFMVIREIVCMKYKFKGWRINEVFFIEKWDYFYRNIINLFKRNNFVKKDIIFIKKLQINLNFFDMFNTTKHFSLILILKSIYSIYF